MGCEFLLHLSCHHNYRIVEKAHACANMVVPIIDYSFCGEVIGLGIRIVNVTAYQVMP